jgi:hypothetical protein
VKLSVPSGPTANKEDIVKTIHHFAFYCPTNAASTANALAVLANAIVITSPAFCTTTCVLELELGNNLV